MIFEKMREYAPQALGRWKRLERTDWKILERTKVMNAYEPYFDVPICRSSNLK